MDLICSGDCQKCAIIKLQLIKYCKRVSDFPTQRIAPKNFGFANRLICPNKTRKQAPITPTNGHLYVISRPSLFLAHHRDLSTASTNGSFVRQLERDRATLPVTSPSLTLLVAVHHHPRAASLHREEHQTLGTSAARNADQSVLFAVVVRGALSTENGEGRRANALPRHFRACRGRRFRGRRSEATVTLIETRLRLFSYVHALDKRTTLAFFFGRRGRSRSRVAPPAGTVSVEMQNRPKMTNERPGLLTVVLKMAVF